RVLGLILVLVAVVLRPRLTKIPKDMVPLDQFPQLQRLVQRVAEAVGTSPPVGVVLNDWFNAAVVRCGPRQQKFLYLAVPLFPILPPEEKGGLLGHELAHFANGDTTRSILAGTTIQTLERWQRLLSPDQIRRPRKFRSIAHLVSDLVTGLLFRAL